jgi:hypothetical protein
MSAKDCRPTEGVMIVGRYTYTADSIWSCTSFVRGCRFLVISTYPLNQVAIGNPILKSWISIRCIVGFVPFSDQLKKPTGRASVLRERTLLHAEILTLRKHLAMVKQTSHKRLRFRGRERLFWFWFLPPLWTKGAEPALLHKCNRFVCLGIERLNWITKSMREPPPNRELS